MTRLAAAVAGGRAQVDLLEADTRWDVCVVGAGPGGQAQPSLLPLCHEVVAAGEQVHAADAARDPRLAGAGAVRDGSVRMFAGTPLRTSDGRVVGVLCVVDDAPRSLTAAQLEALRDLAEQLVVLLEAGSRGVRLEAALLRARAAAHEDPLTGLRNRAGLADALGSLLHGERGGVDPAADDHDSGALLFLDLDRFKEVNDTYGHAAGDAVLRVVADRLVSTVRPGDVVCRFGGDEFVVLLDEIGDGADDVVARLVARVTDPIPLGGLHEGVVVGVGASTGLVQLRGHDASDSVLARADRAMYDAKRRTR